MLTLKNLRLKYPEDEQIIFKNLNIHINKNEKVLLLGPSGSGKSTLLNVLSGIIPRSIDVPMKIDEMNIDKFPGVIFQDPDSQFCMPEVREELAFVLENMNTPPQDMDSLIKDVMKKVDLNTAPTTKINHLSGGMKQKLAIASILLQKSNTLFLDEPTAMLDHKATTKLWDTIMQYWKEQTVVIVEHKVDYIWPFIDRVIVMNENGEITHDNTPEHILKHHTDLLNQYGVWHPYSWEYAPLATYQRRLPFKEQLLQISDLKVKRNKNVLFKINDLRINKGEWVTITGSNGTGKSTFLETLMQLIPYEGKISYENKILKKLKQAARYMYFVYQNPELQFIEYTVYKEIYINFQHHNAKTAHEKTQNMLNLLRLTHVQEHHPFELSIGQKKRLSVATALSTDSKIILLDEPTFGLDSHNTFELIKLFKQRVEDGYTIVMVTHDIEIIKRYTTRLLQIKDNKLIEIDGVKNV